MVLEHVAVFNIKPQSTRSPKRENEKSAYCKREKETEGKEKGREREREVERDQHSTAREVRALAGLSGKLT